MFHLTFSGLSQEFLYDLITESMQPEAQADKTEDERELLRQLGEFTPEYHGTTSIDIHGDGLFHLRLLDCPRCNDCGRLGEPGCSQMVFEWI